MWKKYRFLLFRRVVQISILFLYIAGNIWAWNFLKGNLSSSLVLDKIPLADPFAVLQMFSAGALLTSNIVIGAVIITLFYALVGGRIFCSWVCPVNMVTDLANFIRRKLKFNQIEKKQPASRRLRYYILVLALILSYVLGITAFEFISPISIIHRGIIFGMGLAWAAILVLFLFDLFILKNGWCGHLCPLGGFYSIIGSFSLIRVKHDEQKCTVCMKCKEVCPESQVLWMVGKKSTQVLSGECTNCGRCIEVCDDDALNFSIRTKLGEENETNK
ncbi:quinol dehydrogenase ferredoxin subunit NapH [Halarcobacter mediterraneus]|uniref:Quinol dehydrogenase ferredoxin subunit NapH n=1 Tax=Halarcobacter mediterraneus TaxID=2023153 RepID=A0A4Q1B2J4_9BACT|nr:quinol dehydrogenase ferredoxin subunit NapH [Halarcobacter mediterraneus]